MLAHIYPMPGYDVFSLLLPLFSIPSSDIDGLFISRRKLSPFFVFLPFWLSRFERRGHSGARAERVIVLCIHTNDGCIICLRDDSIPEEVPSPAELMRLLYVHNGRLYNSPEKMDYSRLGGYPAERVHRVRTERKKKEFYIAVVHSHIYIYISISSAG